MHCFAPSCLLFAYLFDKRKTDDELWLSSSQRPTGPMLKLGSCQCRRVEATMDEGQRGKRVECDWLVAEGVENQLSWNLLAGMGCDEAQGYYVCRPLRATALTRWLPDPLEDESPPAAGSPDRKLAYMMPARRGTG